MERLNVMDRPEPDERKLKAAIDRAKSVAEGQRSDLINAASFLLFDLIRNEPFGPRSAQVGMALTLAFLLRHGAAVDVPNEELVGVSYGVVHGQVFVGMVEMWLRDSVRGVRF
jgi:prophage maintenance system killer protein